MYWGDMMSDDNIKEEIRDKDTRDDQVSQFNQIHIHLIFCNQNACIKIKIHANDICTFIQYSSVLIMIVDFSMM